jgi:predicted nucleic acid-binding protein
MSVYIADTNVVSELMKPVSNAHKGVLDWIDSGGNSILTTAITFGEISYGIENMSEGKKKASLTMAFNELVASMEVRTLAYDIDCSLLFGRLKQISIKNGRTAAVEDLQIAAITLVHDAVLATRNTKDFDYLGIRLINPFELD